MANCPRHPVVDTLIAAIGSSRLRHILNSCEHMVQACSHLVEPLARACTHLWLVGTSRERLGAPCEIAWQVAPLATPEDAECLEHLAQIHSARLFVERAQAALLCFSLSQSNAARSRRCAGALTGCLLAELTSRERKVLSWHLAAQGAAQGRAAAQGRDQHHHRRRLGLVRHSPLRL